MSKKMFQKILDLIIEDPEIIKPFIDNLSRKNIDFLREQIPFEDVEELSEGKSYAEMKGLFQNISGSRFLEIWNTYAQKEITNLFLQFSKEFLETLFAKIPREEWVGWWDSLPNDEKIKTLEKSPEDIRLFAISKILGDGEDWVGNEEKEKLMNDFREIWFYFDRTQIREYPPEMKIGLPSFIKKTLKSNPPWSNDPADLGEHWTKHLL